MLVMLAGLAHNYGIYKKVPLSYLYPVLGIPLRSYSKGLEFVIFSHSVHLNLSLKGCHSQMSYLYLTVAKIGSRAI
jgi:hypothetical protein